MRRMLLVLTLALVVAAMLVASALPALAQGPPTTPPGAEFAIPNVINSNPVISFGLTEGEECVSLDAPPGSSSSDRGHHSAYPDVPCEQ